jgi:hypothetical protein
MSKATPLPRWAALPDPPFAEVAELRNEASELRDALASGGHLSPLDERRLRLTNPRQKN